MLRGVSEPKREQIVGGSTTHCIQALYNSYSSTTAIKTNRVRQFFSNFLVCETLFQTLYISWIPNSVFQLAILVP